MTNRRRCLIAAWLSSLSAAAADGRMTWGERLGFGADCRAVIIHADDAGMCFEANAAVRDAVTAGTLRSMSAMAPCPWFTAFANWCVGVPDVDAGLHLCLTSEWREYRWRPLAEAGTVAGLVGPDGFMWRSVAEVARHATPREVDRELRAQLRHARDAGFTPTHLDTHMGAVYARPDITRVYLDLAVDSGIPAMVIDLTPDNLAAFAKQGYPMTAEMQRLCDDYPLPKLDALVSAPHGKTYEEKRERFLALLRALRPGLTQIIIHPAHESECLKAITGSWQQRVWEARLLHDPAVSQSLEAEGIRTTDWREVMRRFRRGDAKPAANPPPRDN